jgi:predicted metalloprotease
MTFRDDAQFNPNQVRMGHGGMGHGGIGHGGMGGKIALGGGAGGLLILVLTLLLGGNPNAVLGGLTESAAGQEQSGVTAANHCRTGADANDSVDCRVVFTMQSLDDVWTAQLPGQTGRTYRAPTVTLFSGQVGTGCGTASSAVGPFYCPADHTAYFDTGFFRVLVDRFGASGGPLAQEYVVAHEVGHSVQNILGTIGRAQSDPRGPRSGGVRTELQADCFAGIWAHFAAVTPAPGGGAPLLHPLGENDVRDALSAAAAVGDDRIQQAAQGTLSPESWTHGSSQQRQAWFTTGYRTGSVRSCDTYSARDLDNPGSTP